jgi:raffinose/stachyose/melibiose transport system permease protein
VTTTVAPVRGHRPRLPAAPLVYVLALVVAGFVIVPVAYVVIGGFRTTGQIANTPFAFPNPWVPSNYGDILKAGSFWREIANSIIIAGVSTGLVVGAGALAAFALARYEFRGRDALYSFFVVGLLFPASVAILPLYLLLRDLHWLDTPWGIAIPEAAFALPITIVILRPFMRAIPGEIEDAAVIDGCSRLAFFWRIMIPLSRPAITTVAVLAFIGSWNAYLLPLLVLDNPNQFTLPLGTAMFSSAHSDDTAKILAFTALSMVPALTFFIFAERRIVGGLTGSIKG